MSSKYYDATAAMQAIGCVYNNPQLLENTDKYVITEDDFDNDFHKIVFGSIYKIFELGANKVSLENILDFLSSRPKSEGIFNAEKGDEWLLKASSSAIPTAFDYYYNRLKKMTLLRAYDKYGIDVNDIYDPDNIFDAKKKQLQEEYIDNTPIEKIADKVEAKIEAIRAQYVNDTFGEVVQAADDIDTLFERLQEHPDVGVPLYGPLINTVTRGARLRKMYLRSAASGFGKSRSMIADVCYVGCDEIYDDNFGWIRNGTAEPTLYITTEQEKDEIQTMMLAFLSGVNEDNILNSTYVGDELERVKKAIQVLKKGKVYIVELPDFSLADVENIIKRNIRENGVKFIFHDYIMTSLKILEEISRRSGGVKIREDNILFMMSRRLKDIANEYGVFVMSSTQLNGNWRECETPDQNLLRGAKSIADSIDYGSILLPVDKTDLESLQEIMNSKVFDVPTMKISVYKNRRGRYKGIYLWCKADLGTCRIKPMFATTWTYELVQMEDLKITVEDGNAF